MMYSHISSTTEGISTGDRADEKWLMQGRCWPTLSEVIGDALQRLHHSSQSGPGVACLAACCNSAAALPLPWLRLAEVCAALTPLIVPVV